MKKINTIVPIICLIINVFLIVGMRIISWPSKNIVVIITIVAVIAIAAAFLESNGLNSHSLRGRLVILFHFLTLAVTGVYNFLHNIDG